MVPLEPLCSCIEIILHQNLPLYLTCARVQGREGENRVRERERGREEKEFSS